MAAPRVDRTGRAAGWSRGGGACRGSGATDRERAVLALTEAVTLVREGHVPDEVYEEASRHFSPQELANLILAMVSINAWNRIGISTRMGPAPA
jgi:alkylhydroperoxidase family enzyme